MDEALRKQALEWCERGRHDIETARLLFDNRGYTDTIAFHIHQAVEKYLKGYLVYLGMKPPRIHELDYLLHQIETVEPGFGSFLEFCEKASGYYLETRYPPGPVFVYSYVDIKVDLTTAQDLIEILDGNINQPNQ